jgi:hypothetical protein
MDQSQCIVFETSRLSDISLSCSTACAATWWYRVATSFSPLHSILIKQLGGKCHWQLAQKLQPEQNLQVIAALRGACNGAQAPTSFPFVHFTSTSNKLKELYSRESLFPSSLTENMLKKYCRFLNKKPRSFGAPHSLAGRFGQTGRDYSAAGKIPQRTRHSFLSDFQCRSVL